jgi:hypothetical protein
MLTHKIIKFKPHVQVPVVLGHFQKNLSPIITQKQLEEHLTQQHSVGVMVRYNTGGNADVYSAAQVNFVLYIERDINKVKTSYNGWPETHLIMQCDLSMAKPWVRWVDPREYVLLTQEQLNKYSNDNVQDYIEEIKSSHPTYLEAISRSYGQTNVDGQADEKQEVQQGTPGS